MYTTNVPPKYLNDYLSMFFRIPNSQRSHRFGRSSHGWLIQVTLSCLILATCYQLPAAPLIAYTASGATLLLYHDLVLAPRRYPKALGDGPNNTETMLHRVRGTCRPLDFGTGHGYGMRNSTS